MGACASISKDTQGQTPEKPIVENVVATEATDNAVEPLVAQEDEAAESAEQVEKKEKEDASADESKPTEVKEKEEEPSEISKA